MTRWPTSDSTSALTEVGDGQSAEQGFAVACVNGGRKHWLWRAVDHDGYVLDEIVQVRRSTKSARRLLIRLIKKQAGLPKRIVTDKLGSYGAARRQVMPTVEHRSHKGLTTAIR